MSYYNDIEQILGDSTTRYFGHGYLNTRQELDEMRVVSRSPGTVDFSSYGRITIPEIWSVKGETIQRPHMSSIDAIELMMLIIEPIWNNLTTPAFPGFQISRIEVTAGKNPLEDALDQIEIFGQATNVDPHEGVSIRATIGNMKVSLWLRGTSTALHDGVAAQSQKVAIKDLIIAAENSSAAAVLHPDDHSTPWKWSLSSCFANSLQLGQVLLYDLDNIDRASSNTLWMRKFTIVVNESIATQDGPQPIYATLKKIKLLDQGTEYWRCADINTVLCGMNLTCSVAHMLPSSSIAAKVA